MILLLLPFGNSDIWEASNTYMTRLTALAAMVLALACTSFGKADNASPPARSAARDGIEAKSKALLAKWKDRFNAERFNASIAGPFVIAGDGSPARIARYRDNTVVAAQRALRAMFFTKEPVEPVLILLFERAEPYKRLAKKWFNDDDVPHYGFFRRSEHVMLMNVGTGTGTLVHELVHALMAPDFPEVPDWFNEGLASLYEQCSISGDTITGHENWRLPDLQAAIRKDRLRSLSEMIEDPKFYGEELVGINYAQSRYLMLYLQEKGLLKDFYKRFRAAVKHDRSGLKTLKQILNTDNLAAFDKTWRKWVLALRFG
jgi:hypothetical protein